MAGDVKTISDLLRRFRSDAQGGVLMMFAFALIPVILVIGCAVDYGMVTRSRTAAQVTADAAALAAATTMSDDVATLRAAAEKFVRSNFDEATYGKVQISSFTYSQQEKDITIRLAGATETSFMRLAGYQTVPFEVMASSTRAVPGTTEVALVLDNTWSMSGAKIVALKTAAKNLVETLKKDPKNTVKIALVPYADYVNVGVSNRGQSWVKVPADYVKVNKGSCWTVSQKCQKAAQKTCVRLKDGVPESYDCSPQVCFPITPYQQCSADSTQQVRWFGCVGTRVSGSLRLNDDEPSSPYPGFLSTSQNCLNPVVPLTESKDTIQKAIASMVVNVGGYKPSTYIPGGLIWGLNVLSPSQPFGEGKAYDANNQDPRKALVLMTDGANTMKYNSKDGTHVDASGKDLDQTYADQLNICANIRKRNITVYTVAFDVDDAAAKDTLKACASKAEFAFDAKDAAALNDAFSKIATSLSSLRLTR